ncbi:MAG: hypothetical protein LBS76_01510 [Mycoplasmataceae bacterium]|nr:hypothetical protein [Mycoplasmataceae bacterium]
MVRLSKFEVFILVDFLVFTLAILIVSYVGFLGYDWQIIDADTNTFNPLFMYGTPLIDTIAILPMLVLNVMCFIDNAWNVHVGTKYSLYGNNKDKHRFQFRLLTILLILISVSLIFSIWGEPDNLVFTLGGLIVELFKDPEFMNEYIFSCILFYLALLLIISNFFFCIFYFGFRIRQESKGKVLMFPRKEFVIYLINFLIIAIFLISTSVYNMWANFDKENIMYTTIGVINLGIALPTLVVSTIGYTSVVERNQK